MWTAPLWPELCKNKGKSLHSLMGGEVPPALCRWCRKLQINRVTWEYILTFAILPMIRHLRVLSLAVFVAPTSIRSFNKSESFVFTVKGFWQHCLWNWICKTNCGSYGSMSLGLRIFKKEKAFLGADTCILCPFTCHKSFSYLQICFTSFCDGHSAETHVIRWWLLVTARFLHIPAEHPLQSWSWPMWRLSLL